MTPMPTQPTPADPAAQYAAEARAVLTVHEHLGYPALTQDEVQQRQMARAQVAATLALAEEQRTANLIARAQLSIAASSVKIAAPLAAFIDNTVDARLAPWPAS